LQVAAQELAAFTDKQFNSIIFRDNQKSITQLSSSNILIDKQLQMVIAEDQQVHQVYQLATSVTGIGLQTAAYLILYTQCVNSFDNWRQLACFAGTAPFEYTSIAVSVAAAS
jgi:hypothetical protein